MDLSHQQLLIFVDLARERNFSKVAQLHHLTQPAISARVKQLEEVLGVKLFERVPRKVLLTKEGELLLPYAQDLLLRCENMRGVIERAKRSPVGDIKVSAVYSLGIYELGSKLREFMSEFPNIHVQMQYRRSDIIYDLLRKGKIELGIVPYPDKHSGVKVVPCGSDRLLLVAAPGHPLAKKRSVSIETLQDQAFLMFPENVSTGQQIRKLFAEMGIEVTVRLTDHNIDTLKRSAEAGLGLSILPEKAVAEELRRNTLRVIRLDNIEISRPFGAIMLRDKVLSYPAELFVEMLSGSAIAQSLDAGPAKCETGQV